MAYNNNTLPRSGKVTIVPSDQNTPPARVRPVSLYDNIQQQQDAGTNPNNSSLCATPFRSTHNAPSQALCLNTTVPVNFARSAIAGRHTPTRASLRHSRMLVLSQQSGRVPLKYLPPVIRCHRLASTLMVLLVLLGLAGAGVASWLAVVAPFLTVRDLPFWSSGLNLMAGLAGLLLVCWCRREHPGVPGPEWVCVARQPYIGLVIGLAVLATAASVCACVFTALRLLWVAQVECLLGPEIALGLTESTSSSSISDAHTVGFNDDGASSSSSSSVSIVPASNVTSFLVPASTAIAPLLTNSWRECACNVSESERYPGLACPGLRMEVTGFLVSSGAIHAIAVLLIVVYLVLHWKNRRYGQAYAHVRSNSTPRLVATGL